MWPLLLGLGGIAANAIGQSQANAMNQEQFTTNMMNNNMQAEAQRQWATGMANSAHQREVADLKAAGLNPILSGLGGGGATTPSGATGSSSVGNAAQNPMAMASSALELVRLKQERDRNESQIDLNDALKSAARADAALKANNSRTAAANAIQAEAETPAVIAAAKLSEKRARFDEGLVKYDGVADRVGRAVGMITNGYTAFSRGGWHSRARNKGFAEGYEKGTRAGMPVD